MKIGDNEAVIPWYFLSVLLDRVLGATKKK